jgi:hypothetical protein
VTDEEGGRRSIASATKDDARQWLARLGLPSSQARGVDRAVARATTSSSIEIVATAGGSVTVRVTRAGRDGYQVIESQVEPGGRKSVVQKAYNSAGQLVHHDPKTPGGEA